MPNSFLVLPLLFLLIFYAYLYQLVSERISLARMAPETRSRDQRLGDLESRLETHFSLVESNRERLDKNVADISELRNSMSRIEVCLKDITGSIRRMELGVFVLTIVGLMR